MPTHAGGTIGFVASKRRSTNTPGTVQATRSDAATIDPWSNPRVKECVPEVMLGSFR
jgi:hypothetical protein